VTLPAYVSDADGAALVRVRVQPRSRGDKIVRLAGVAAADLPALTT
jgi:hypothetical protein